MAEGGGPIRELLAVFGFEVDSKGLEKGETAVGNFAERLKGLAEGIAAAFAVEKIYEFAESNVKAMTQIERTGAALGITTDKVQELQFASKSLGMDSGELLNLMGKLQVAQFNAGREGGRLSQTFTDLGVSTHDASGKLKPVDALLGDIAEGIKNTRDPAKAAAEAVALFGRGGRVLLPFLKEGRAGVEELSAAYHELGGGFSADTIEKAKAFEKQSARLSLVLTGLKDAIMRQLLPILTPMITGMTAVAHWFKEAAKNSEIVKATLIVLGGVATYFAVQMAIAAAPILLMASALGFLILLVDDIITMFSGGQSVVGDAIDSMFGKGATTELIRDLKDAWADMVPVFKDLWSAAKPVFDALMWLVSTGAGAIKTLLGVSAGAWGQIGDALGRGRNALNESELVDPNSPSARADRGVLASGGGSYAALPMTGAGGVTVHEGDVHLEVNVGHGADGKQIGEQINKTIDEHRKRERRETFSTLQRAPAAAGGR